MHIKIFNENPYKQNTYIYYNETTKNAIIIDPGLSKTQILKVIEKYTVIAIILTHGHFDHIFSLQKVKEVTNADVYAYVEEKQLLLSPKLNMSNPTGTKNSSIIANADIYVTHGEILQFMDISFKVIHTPGHTSGGMSLYDETNGVLFSGDTLFKQSVGRTDLPTSNYDDLVKSLNTLMKLPNETIVYSGHGEPTTIGHERENNPYV